MSASAWSSACARLQNRPSRSLLRRWHATVRRRSTRRCGVALLIEPSATGQRRRSFPRQRVVRPTGRATVLLAADEPYALAGRTPVREPATCAESARRHRRLPVGATALFVSVPLTTAVRRAPCQRTVRTLGYHGVAPSEAVRAVPGSLGRAPWSGGQPLHRAGQDRKADGARTRRCVCS